MRPDVARLAAPVYVLAESRCAMHRGLAHLERRLAAGDASAKNLAGWVSLLEELREAVIATDASLAQAVEGLRQIRENLIAQGEWEDDEGAFAPCGCFRVLQPCSRCGLQDILSPGCEHAPALCAGCASR